MAKKKYGSSGACMLFGVNGYNPMEAVADQPRSPRLQGQLFGPGIIQAGVAIVRSPPGSEGDVRKRILPGTPQKTRVFANHVDAAVKFVYGGVCVWV